MKIIGDTVEFKSLPSEYNDEFTGKVPVTTRVLTDEEFLNCASGVERIMITDSSNGQSFIRDLWSVKDVTPFLRDVLRDDFEGRICSFSWLPA